MSEVGVDTQNSSENQEKAAFTPVVTAAFTEPMVPVELPFQPVQTPVTAGEIADNNDESGLVQVTVRLPQSVVDEIDAIVAQNPKASRHAYLLNVIKNHGLLTNYGQEINQRNAEIQRLQFIKEQLEESLNALNERYGILQANQRESSQSVNSEMGMLRQQLDTASQQNDNYEQALDQVTTDYESVCEQYSVLAQRWNDNIGQMSQNNAMLAGLRTAIGDLAILAEQISWEHRETITAVFHEYLDRRFPILKPVTTPGLLPSPAPQPTLKPVN